MGATESKLSLKVAQHTLTFVGFGFIFAHLNPLIINFPYVKEPETPEEAEKRLFESLTTYGAEYKDKDELQARNKIPRNLSPSEFMLLYHNLELKSSRELLPKQKYNIGWMDGKWVTNKMVITELLTLYSQNLLRISETEIGTFWLEISPLNKYNALWYISRYLHITPEKILKSKLYANLPPPELFFADHIKRYYETSPISDLNHLYTPITESINVLSSSINATNDDNDGHHDDLSINNDANNIINNERIENDDKIGDDNERYIMNRNTQIDGQSTEQNNSEIIIINSGNNDDNNNDSNSNSNNNLSNETVMINIEDKNICSDNNNNDDNNNNNNNDDNNNGNDNENEEINNEINIKQNEEKNESEKEEGKRTDIENMIFDTFEDKFGGYVRILREEILQLRDLFYDEYEKTKEELEELPSFWSQRYGRIFLAIRTIWNEKQRIWDEKTSGFNIFEYFSDMVKFKIGQYKANWKIFYYSLDRQYDVIRWSILRRKLTNPQYPKYNEEEILKPDEEFIPGIYLLRVLFPESEIRTSSTFSNQFLFNFYNSYTFSSLCAQELIARNYLYMDPIEFRKYIANNYSISMLMILLASIKIAVNSKILPHIHYPKLLNNYPIKLYKIPLRLILPYIVLSTLANGLRENLSPLTMKGLELTIATSWIKSYFMKIEQEKRHHELPLSLLPYSFIVTQYPGENVWITRLKDNFAVPSDVPDINTKFDLENKIRLA